MHTKAVVDTPRDGGRWLGGTGSKRKLCSSLIPLVWWSNKAEFSGCQIRTLTQTTNISEPVCVLITSVFYLLNSQQLISSFLLQGRLSLSSLRGRSNEYQEFLGI